jgi:hypothetical protein
MDSYELLSNMNEAAEQYGRGIISVEGDGGHHYFTFASAYSAPAKWAALGKWGQRLYPTAETVKELVAELGEWENSFV